MEVELGRARKAVVKQAHDAIFAAEHATLTDTESEDTQQMVGLVQDQISRLKEVIVSDYWPKGQVIGMIDQLKATQKALENKINEENENVVTEMEASEDGSSEALQVLEASDTENGDGTAVPEGEAANDTGRRPSPTLITFLVRRP